MSLLNFQVYIFLFFILLMVCHVYYFYHFVNAIQSYNAYGCKRQWDLILYLILFTRGINRIPNITLAFYAMLNSNKRYISPEKFILGIDPPR